MAKSKKQDTEVMPMINEARIELAKAITDVGNAERALEAAKTGRSDAQQNLYAANRKLEQLEAERPGRSKQHANGMAAAALAGKAYDVAAIERRADALETDARREVEAWRQTLEAGVTLIAERQNDKNWAEERLKKAVLAVIRAESGSIIATALDGIEELQAEVTKRRLILSLLLRRELIPAEQSEPVKRLLGFQFLPGDEDGVWWPAWNGHPTMIAWGQVAEALKTDASVPLPTL